MCIVSQSLPCQKPGNGAGRLEGQLAAEKQAHCAVSKDLVAAQREMEGLVWRNQELELELANAAMGGQAHQVQVEQQELRASWEAQSAELASVKVSTPGLSCNKTCLFSPFSHPLFVLVRSAPGSFHHVQTPRICPPPPHLLRIPCYHAPFFAKCVYARKSGKGVEYFLW